MEDRWMKMSRGCNKSVWQHFYVLERPFSEMEPYGAESYHLVAPVHGPDGSEKEGYMARSKWKSLEAGMRLS